MDTCVSVQHAYYCTAELGLQVVLPLLLQNLVF